MYKKITILFMCILSVSIISCDGNENSETEDNSKKNVYAYGDEILSEDALLKAAKAFNPETEDNTSGTSGIKKSGSLTGDVNSDGVVDIIDGLLTAKFYVGYDIENFNVEAADVDLDGSITIIDALLIARYYVGLIDNLPFVNIVIEGIWNYSFGDASLTINISDDGINYNAVGGDGEDFDEDYSISVINNVEQYIIIQISVYFEEFNRYFYYYQKWGYTITGAEGIALSFGDDIYDTVEDAIASEISEDFIPFQKID